MASDKWLYHVDGMHQYKGILMMPDSTVSVLKWFEEELEFQDGDVLLTSYPAAGIRWLQEVAWHMHHLDTLDTALEVKEKLGKRVPHADHEFFNKVTPKELFNSESAPRVYKSHVPARLMERHLTGKAKVIFWSADPRSILPKYCHMYNTLGKFLNFPDISWDDFFTLFKEKQLFEGDWFETTKSFLPHVGKSDFLFLQYEDAASDLTGTVRKISEFLGVALGDETVERLAHVVPFDKLPDWSKTFTPSQLQYYSDVYRREMKDTPLGTTYSQ